MVLVDTSIWIEHFRVGEDQLAELLTQDLILIHPFVVGELACGSLKRRAMIFEDLGRLPSVPFATHEEVLQLIEERKLYGHGIGWIDAHLIASALLANCSVWTLDGRLRKVCKISGVKLYL